MKTLVILQSNYIPWKGYFDLMAVADEFILFDEVQYTKNDWRNRNKIVLNGKLHWLTIPVAIPGRTLIRDVQTAGNEWPRIHQETIRQAYRKAPYFDWASPTLEEAYQQASTLKHLSQINALFLKSLAGLLGLSTPLVPSDEVYRTTDDPTARLIEICRSRGATHYVSGPAARAYIDQRRFEDAGIVLEYASYEGYPVYEQGNDAFEHGVSVVDLLMRVGSSARDHLKSLRNRSSFLLPAS